MDIAYGSTLIILIISNHFRMAQTWILFPGHYGHVCSHSTVICPQNVTRPQSVIINVHSRISSVLDRLYKQDRGKIRHRHICKHSEDIQYLCFPHNWVAVPYYFLSDILYSPILQSSSQKVYLHPLQDCITQTILHITKESSIHCKMTCIL